MKLRIIGKNKERKEQDLPKDPCLIRKLIERFVGRIDSAFQERGGASYALKVRNEAQADQLLTMERLDDLTVVQVYEHPTRNSTKCVVSCRQPVKSPDAKVEEMLDGQNIAEFHRIIRQEGGDLVSTTTIFLDVRGTSYPEFVDSG